jgi:quinone-modifying oxidoreductase subunit QmoA
MTEKNSLPILVLGAGIAGVSTALESAEAGREVLLVESGPAVGGRVVRTHHYFPKMCPPTCGMELNSRRLEKNRRIRVLTGTRMTAADRANGSWKITLTSSPAYVNDKCTACGACSEVCPGRVADPMNLGMCEVPAVRLPYPSAWPLRFTLDRDACPEGCKACADACQYDAIDLEAQSSEEAVEVSAVVIATGWHPYPLEKLPELGGGLLPDVIANVNMERMASAWGPTAGKILRPSNGEPPKKVAFVQCAGSRDVNHLQYCSSVCCLASLKQALYVKEQLPDAEVVIYYIDRRTPGRNEEVLTRVAATEGVKLVKGKVGKVAANPAGGLLLKVEDVEANRLEEAGADLVVLATGMVPNVGSDDLPLNLKLDEDNFAIEDLPQGVAVAGVTRRPQDVASSVRDATGAAAKAWAIGEGVS